MAAPPAVRFASARRIDKTSSLPLATSQCAPLRPHNSTSRGPAYQLPNGRYLDACLVFKAGWTDWHLLFLRATHAKPEAHSYEPYAHSPLVPRFSFDLNASCAFDVTRIIIVRNPYERLLSYYLDKVVASCNHGPRAHAPCSKSGYWPPGLALNATFAMTARQILQAGASFNSRLSELHYAPIAHSYKRCLDGGRRVLHLEDIDVWYAGLVEELGLREVVSSGWRTGCFHVPAHSRKGCATALDPPPLVAATASTASTAADRTQMSRHNRGAATRLREYYDADTARLVTQYARDDLRAFGYAAWDGVQQYRPLAP
jgi:hypothetical protein